MSETKLNISDEFRSAMNEAEERAYNIKFTTKNICRAIKTYIDRNRHIFGDKIAEAAVESLDQEITQLLVDRYAYEQNLYEYVAAMLSKEETTTNEEPEND